MGKLDPASFPAGLEPALAQLQAEGLIYRPAGRKRLVRSEVCDPAVHRISIIRPDWPSLVLDAILRSIVQAGRERDWAFDPVHYRHEEGLDLDRVIGSNDGAVLMLTTEPLPEHWRQALQRPRKPIVLAQDEVSDAAVSSVCSDDQAMARLAVEHLAELGQSLADHLRRKGHRGLLRLAWHGDGCWANFM